MSRGILSPLRLPISPLRRASFIYIFNRERSQGSTGKSLGDLTITLIAFLEIVPVLRRTLPISLLSLTTAAARQYRFHCPRQRAMPAPGIVCRSSGKSVQGDLSHSRSAIGVKAHRSENPCFVFPGPVRCRRPMDPKETL